MLVAAGIQGMLALAGGYPLFFASAVITLALASIAFMQTALAPPITLHNDGLTLHPVVWRERHVPWSAVRAVRPNPLLPPENTESVRRAVEGRRRYQPARGVLVIIPSLPLQYRIAGFFAGEGFTGVIALGSRTHVNDDSLLAGVQTHLPVDQSP